MPVHAPHSSPAHSRVRAHAFLTVLLVVLLVPIAAASPAGAERPPQIHVEIRVTEQRPGAGVARNSRPSPFLYERHEGLPLVAGFILSSCIAGTWVPGEPGLISADEQGPTPDGFTGRSSTLIRTNRATGAVVVTYACTVAGSPSSIPPLPPTYADFWAEATRALPVPSIGASPDSVGLTGLDTYLWSGPTSRDEQVAVTAGPWTVSGHAGLRSFELRIVDDASGAIVAVQAVPRAADGSVHFGGPSDPLVRWSFRSRGRYRVELGAVWAIDTASVTGPDVPPTVVPMGTVTIPVEIVYPVDEARAVITG
ncbi:MAG: hypothetical protein JWL73_3362 [Actinomycetia bacterium]|nr:hypothetical protein [Actinomycetes bacterium]